MSSCCILDLTNTVFCNTDTVSNCVTVILRITRSVNDVNEIYLATVQLHGPQRTSHVMKLTLYFLIILKHFIFTLPAFAVFFIVCERYRLLSRRIVPTGNVFAPLLPPKNMRRAAVATEIYERHWIFSAFSGNKNILPGRDIKMVDSMIKLI